MKNLFANAIVLVTAAAGLTLLVAGYMSFSACVHEIASVLSSIMSH